MALSRALLAAACVLAFACMASAAPSDGVFVAANIVESWDKCPVKKPTEWDPKVFDPSLDALSEMQNSKYASAISKKCQDTLLALADCASDNDAFATDPAAASITSLSTINGCCTKDCSDKIKSAIAAGCFDELLATSLCVDPDAQKFKTGLFNAGVRCANYKAECPAPGAKPAAKPAAAANATAPAAAAAAKPAAAAAAAAPKVAVSPAPAAGAKKENGAAGKAVSAVLAVAGAAAILAL